MIARLRGEVAEPGADRLVLDVNGVGYELLVPARTAEAARPGATLTLHVHTSVREDAIVLFGFSTLAEKSAFEQLVAVNGVGPRTALSILSSLAPDALARAIEGNDLKTLTSVSGVGKKTAERLVLELRGKLAYAPASAASVAHVRATPEDPLPLALAQLGYKKSEIDLALAKLAEQGLAAGPLDARLQASLRYFSGAALTSPQTSPR